MSKNAVLNLIKKTSSTLILVTHDKVLASVCARVLFVSHGQIRAVGRHDRLKITNPKYRHLWTPKMLTINNELIVLIGVRIPQPSCPGTDVGMMSCGLIDDLGSNPHFSRLTRRCSAASMLSGPEVHMAMGRLR